MFIFLMTQFIKSGKIEIRLERLTISDYTWLSVPIKKDSQRKILIYVR